MRRPIGAALALACLAGRRQASGQGGVSYSPPLPLSPAEAPLPFPFLEGDLTTGYSMKLPSDFMETLLEDALKLKSGGISGSYKDAKGTTWWQPKKEPRRFSLEQMVEIIGRLDFPGGIPKHIVGAEYWVQVRRGDADGGFHYDKDESAASNKQRMIFPSLSTITYLTDGGAPTVILNQTTNQFGNDEVPAVPSEGYLSFPATGKHIHFNGKAQHGVAGGICQTGCDKDRVVLLINWWDHAPEPPNCQRLSTARVKDLGFSRVAKADLKAMKAAVTADAEKIQPKPLESLRASGSTRVTPISLPPVDVLELTLPERFAHTETGPILHFALGPEKASLLGSLDPNKRTQVAHIQHSAVPVLFAYIEPAQAPEVNSVLRPIQMALWAGGLVRQHLEIYVGYADTCGRLMQDHGVTRKDLPAFVLQDGRTRTATRMNVRTPFPVPPAQRPSRLRRRVLDRQEAFSASTLKGFLSSRGIPLATSGGGVAGLNALGCLPTFDTLAADFYE